MVIGPIYSSEIIGSTPGPYRFTERFRYRQAAPYKNPLPYKRYTCHTISTPNNQGTLLPTNTIIPSSVIYGTEHTATASKAYERFRDSLMDKMAQVGADLAEGHSTWSMMAGRVSQITRFAGHLKSFRIRQAVRALELHPSHVKWTKTGVQIRLDTPTGRREVELKRGLKHFGNNFLEFHFGWEPLVKSIHESLSIVMDHPLNGYDRGLLRTVTGKATFTGAPPADQVLSNGQLITVRGVTKVRYLYQAHAEVENPNLHLASRLGLINPLAVAWELVPFSFVVDWFSNVGTVINSYTDFAGIRVTQNFVSKTVSIVDHTWTRSYKYPSWVTTRIQVKTGSSFERSLGTSMAPKLAFKQVKLPSATRAATAISLLSQLLRAH